jgi:protein phosphatase
MGTTLTVAMSFSDELFVANLGDSRAYLLRGSELTQLTRDHTLAQAMIDAGVATEGDETVNRMRRILTAAVGSTAPPTDPDVQRLKLLHGDQLLLATDGLTDCVEPDTIASILREAGSADEACGALIEKALACGSKDNITVLVARYRFPHSNVA